MSKQFGNRDKNSECFGTDVVVAGADAPVGGDLTADPAFCSVCGGREAGLSYVDTLVIVLK